jgi:predicted lipoprotein with Yx(FWY)xxD motif
MRRSHVVVALLVLVAIPLTACGSGTGSPSTSAAAPPVSSMMDHPESSMATEESMHPASDAMTTAPAGSAEATGAGAMITTAASDFGQILFDGTGQAIYLFDKESTATPDCYGDCAAAWPPVLTVGAPVAGTGLMADLLGVTPRTDGSTQVTYAGRPLYYYAGEGKNEVTCHNVSEFGGRWLVVTPTGKAAA